MERKRSDMINNHKYGTFYRCEQNYCQAADALVKLGVKGYQGYSCGKVYLGDSNGDYLCVEAP